MKNKSIKHMLQTTIPTLDLSDFLSGNTARKNAFVSALGAAYETIGFVAIKNHGYSEDSQVNLYNSIKQFYQLSDDVKSKYDGSHTGGQRGYTGKGKEHAAGRDVGDLKEFYHIGKEIPGNVVPYLPECPF